MTEVNPDFADDRVKQLADILGAGLAKSKPWAAGEPDSVQSTGFITIEMTNAFTFQKIDVASGARSSFTLSPEQSRSVLAQCFQHAGDNIKVSVDGLTLKMDMTSDEVAGRIAEQSRKTLKKAKSQIWRAGFTMVDIKGVEVEHQIEPPGREWEVD